MQDYTGYKWGYITSEGKRTPEGDPVPPNAVIGVWGEFSREGKEKCRCETFLKEIPNKDNAPLTRMQNINRQQCITAAYPEGSTPGNYAIPYVAPEPDTTQLFQEWLCECGHTFYTEIGIKRTLKQFVKGQFKYIECESCHKIKAKRAGKVRKEIK